MPTRLSVVGLYHFYHDNVKKIQLHIVGKKERCEGNRIKGYALRMKCLGKMNRGSLLCGSQLCTYTCRILGISVPYEQVYYCVIYPFTAAEVA